MHDEIAFHRLGNAEFPWVRSRTMYMSILTLSDGVLSRQHPAPPSLTSRLRGLICHHPAHAGGHHEISAAQAPRTFMIAEVLFRNTVFRSLVWAVSKCCQQWSPVRQAKQAALCVCEDRNHVTVTLTTIAFASGPVPPGACGGASREAWKTMRHPRRYGE